MEWRESVALPGMEDALAKVDPWKGKHPKLSLTAYEARFPAAYTASAKGTCFLDAVRIAALALN